MLVVKLSFSCFWFILNFVSCCLSNFSDILKLGIENYKEAVRDFVCFPCAHPSFFLLFEIRIREVLTSHVHHTIC